MPDDQVTFGEHRTRERDIAAATRLHQHSPEPRMDRQTVHFESDCREPSVTNRAEPCEQGHCRLDAVHVRRIEPLERARMSGPRDDLERCLAQIHPVDLGYPMRTQPIGRAPQPARAPWSEPARAPRALLRRVSRYALELQRIDRAVRLEARHILK